jgi:hypothetical protein
MSEPQPARQAPSPSTRLHRVRDWGPPLAFSAGTAYIADLSVIRTVDEWSQLWPGERHNHRFFEIVDQTITGEIEYFYLIVEDEFGNVRGIQPVFTSSQKVLGGVNGRLRPIAERLERIVPRLVEYRTLWAGSPVGEGVLGAHPRNRLWLAQALGELLPLAAAKLGASLTVFKEFPSELRPTLSCLLGQGYTRMPSMPYVTLDFDFASFEEHLSRLSKNARRDFRRKAKSAERFPPLRMEVLNDISSRLDELYPLYLQVYERASLRFEKLTPEYFRRMGREMPDRARFMIWTQNGRAVGFYSAMVHNGVLWLDYIGMEYGVALDLHLYFLMKRDAIDWGCRNGVLRYCGGPLNYDPKLHLGCRLKPMDLYLRHSNPVVNAVLSRASPWLSPTRHEPILQKFPNADEMR